MLATLAALPMLDLSGRSRNRLFVSACLRDALADRCEALVAVDAAEGALSQAARPIAVTARMSRSRAPSYPTTGRTAPTISCSCRRWVYYLGRSDVDRLASKLCGSTRTGADIVLVHWLGLTDYPLSGDEAADWFIRCSSPFARVIHRQPARTYIASTSCASAVVLTRMTEKDPGPRTSVITLNKARDVHLHRLLDGAERGTPPDEIIVVEMGAVGVPRVEGRVTYVPLPGEGFAAGPSAATRGGMRRQARS